MKNEYSGWIRVWEKASGTLGMKQFCFLSRLRPLKTEDGEISLAGVSNASSPRSGRLMYIDWRHEGPKSVT